MQPDLKAFFFMGNLDAGMACLGGSYSDYELVLLFVDIFRL